MRQPIETHCFLTVGLVLFSCLLFLSGCQPDGTKTPVTSATCQECHEKECDLWAHTRHAKAERVLDRDDQAAFELASTIKQGSQESQVRFQNGECQIVTLGFETNMAAYKVERVIGRVSLCQFLTAAPGGRFQVQQVSYDPVSSSWFDVYEDERLPGEWGHWTGQGMNWNSRCAACHNTGVRKNYDEKSDSYHTTVGEMAVGCEA